MSSSVALSDRHRFDLRQVSRELVLALSRREDELGLKAVRIALGLVLLADLVRQYIYLGLLPQVHGWPLRPILLAWCGILLCMIVGYRPRAAAVGSYLCCILVFRSEEHTSELQS